MSEPSAPVRILAFAGSTRSGSYNKKLLRVAVRHAEALGASVTVLDLREHPLPLYDGDLEAQGMPAEVLALKKLFGEQDALLVASPEYNASYSAVLKNFIDWVSRTVGGESSYAAFRGKTAAILTASPGYYGGVRSAMSLRALLAFVQCLVIPEQFNLPKAQDAFDEQGALKDAKQNESVKSVVAALIAASSKKA